MLETLNFNARLEVEASLVTQSATWLPSLKQWCTPSACLIYDVDDVVCNLFDLHIVGRSVGQHICTNQGVEFKNKISVLMLAVLYISLQTQQPELMSCCCYYSVWALRRPWLCRRCCPSQCPLYQHYQFLW